MKATIVFEKNYDAVEKEGVKYIINKGSSRSSKTHSLLQLFWVLAWSRSNVKLAVFRFTKKDCKDTVLQDMLKYYPTLPMYENVVFNKSESYFTFPNGSKIFIEGTDDELKVMGYHSDFLWLNEFYKINKSTFDQLDMRCSGKVFMDYNPVGKHWVDDIIKQDKAVVIHSTFKDNPFVPKAQKEKILSYEPTAYNIEQKTANNYMWQVFGLGLKAEKPNRIFKNWERINNALFESLQLPTYYGLDFGNNAPSTLTEVKYDNKTKTFFARLLIYKPMNKMQSNDGHGIVKEFELLNIPKNIPIIVDSADKDNRLILMRNGYNIIIANKGSGSVVSSISLLQQSRICYVENEDVEREYENYEWEIINGVNLDRPIKKDDHFIDGFKYCVTWLYKYLNIK